MSVTATPQSEVLSSTTTNYSPTLLERPPLLYINSFIKEYFSYFSIDFLIVDGAKPLRYKSPGIGVLTHFEFVLFVIGVIYAIRDRKRRLPLFLLLIAPLAAALTREDSPNLNRSLLMLPFIIILMATGLNDLSKDKKLLSGLLLIGVVLNFFYFWKVYNQNSIYLVGPVRNYAAREMVFSLDELSKKYEFVVVTHDPDDPYPWYAFYIKQNPAEFNPYAIKRKEGAWQYKNIIFSQDNCPSGNIFPDVRGKPLDKNILVIDGFKCAVEAKIKDGMQAKVLKQIYNPDGTVGYTFWIPR